MPRIRPVLASLLLALVLVPAASAASFDDIYGDYKGDGTIDACKYSESDLQKAKGDVPPDIEQYAPDFPAALDAAITKRAGGGCAKGGAGTTTAPAAAAPAAGGGTPTTPAAATVPATPGATTPAATTPATGTTPEPTSAQPPAGAPRDGAVARTAQRTSTQEGASDTPAPLVALIVLGALLLLVGLSAAIVRGLGWEPAWLLDARHASAEAGYRSSTRWAEFRDWLRLGH